MKQIIAILCISFFTASCTSNPTIEEGVGTNTGTEITPEIIEVSPTETKAEKEATIEVKNDEAVSSSNTTTTSTTVTEEKEETKKEDSQAEAEALKDIENLFDDILGGE